MAKRDLRKISRELRDDIHLQAVTAVRKENKRIGEVAATFGVSRQSLYFWLQRFDAEGKKGLISGKAKGSPRCL